MIVQVIINLIDNAIKYSGEGSTICLTTEKSNDVITVSVSDDGPGLALCKSIIEAHGGVLTVETNKSSGVTFRFTLPEAEGIQSNGYVAQCVSSGEAGIMALTNLKTDIVLLDLGLPDMDGVSLIKKVREWSQVPIIVVSARSEDQDKIKALDNGADDYLTKPFSIEELMARIRVAQRRIINAESSEEGAAVFKNGDLEIDYLAGMASLRKKLKLTPHAQRTYKHTLVPDIGC